MPPDKRSCRPQPEQPPEPDLSNRTLIVRLTMDNPCPVQVLREVYPRRVLRQTLTPDQAENIHNCLSHLKENNRALWMNHLAHTIPFPGKPRDWNRRLLPLQHYKDYAARMNRLLETRIDLLLKLSRCCAQAAAGITNRQLPAPGTLTTLLRQKFAAGWQTEPAPTLAEFQEEQSRRSRLRRLLPAAVRPLGREDSRSQYEAAARTAARLWLVGPPAATAWRDYQQVEARENAAYSRQELLSRLPGARIRGKLLGSLHRRRNAE